jgi:predicted transcriptional regulator|nr:MAG TPA: Alginate and motility regulator [Caudoviricetes sp.]DAO20329.1 MAG TPA: Alginate and motility regulator [Caudoviricetes sp.]DAP70939.1 MAG TPA: Alginate and motility regulator [Caudoviricetes sp.]DAY13685.1 MAG TPA: Alginate and motility regulator [Bacteriophage sp.]
MSPKLGQKIKDNPKDKRIEIRMDDETVRKLDILANEQNVSRAKVIRQGIEMQYKNRQK